MQESPACRGFSISVISLFGYNLLRRELLRVSSRELRAGRDNRELKRFSVKDMKN
jgi:hypothetical protein